MFDIGFWELIMVGVVALLLVGPERLPELASFIGRWVGRGRRLMNTIRADVEKEVATHNLNKILKQGNEDNLEIIEQTRKEFKDIADALKDPASKPPATAPDKKPDE